MIHQFLRLALSVLLLLGIAKKPVPQPGMIKYLFMNFRGSDTTMVIPRVGRWVEGPASSVNDDRARAIRRVHVFIDGSVSMRGFVRAGEPGGQSSEYTEFLTLARGILERPGLSVTYYKFGKTVETLPAAAAASWQPNFYNQPDTDLDNLLERLEQSGDANLFDIALIITDGVQSPPEAYGPDALTVANRIALLIEKGYHFEILVLESYFNGNAYSELRRQQGLPEVIGNFKGARPFYVYVISRDSGYGKKFFEDLHTYGFKGRVRYLDLTLTKAIGSLAKIVAPVYVSGLKRERNFLGNYDVMEGVTYLFWKSAKAKGMGRIDIELPLSTERLGSLSIPRIEPDMVKVLTKALEMEVIRDGQQKAILRPTICEVRVVSIESKGGCFAPEYVIGTQDGIGRFGVQPRPPSGEGRLTIGCFIRTSTHGMMWTACEIEIGLSANALSLPEWLDYFSTDDDTNLSAYDKTFRFKQFVTDIVSASIGDFKTLGKGYVVIRKGK